MNKPYLAKVAVALTLLASSPASFAGALDFYYQDHLLRASSLTSLKSNIKTNYFNQLVDHKRPALGFFSQRYYLDDQYATSSDAPVFFYICGESVCRPQALSGEIREMAKKYHARLIALEHRYYGESLPRPSFSTSDLQYLTTDLALKDLAVFQQAMSESHHWTGKWVTFGGSYPGSLSAYYRLRYPELAVGALASSAPVQAKDNFEEYDAHVTKVAGPRCAEQMREAYREIEAAVTDSSRMTQIKRSFGVEALKDNTDFLFFVADIGSAAVQYGYKQKFCNMLAEGSSSLAGFADFSQYLYQAWGIENPMSLAMQGAESENPGDYADGLGMRQWYYQSCTEYGYWQGAHHDPEKSTRSSWVSTDYFHEACHRLFGIDVPANTESINERFYQPLQNESASRIFFTNGSNDPWSLLSLSATNGNASNANLTYYTIDGAAHCGDLHASRENDSAALKRARQQLSGLLSAWLATTDQ